MKGRTQAAVDGKATEGAAIAVARVAVEKSYPGIAPLLKEVIRNRDEAAWGEIKARIDYTFRHVDAALSALDKETGFLSQVRGRLEQGRKLLFKPNLVSMESINPYTLLPLPGSVATTAWPFVAAVMRWFHDKGRISYYRMALGDGATLSAVAAASYTLIKGTGRPVTPEAVIEGRSDAFYGGWGFSFARRYLAEASDPALGDDPLQGLEESMGGIYLPPGVAGDRLMVYDLNRIDDDPTKGREVPVPHGVNFPSIILHKAVCGGDPDDPADRARYPGSVLINLPKLKVHNMAMFTNAVKSLGMGLYPMQASRTGNCQWEYATPHSEIPGLKTPVPHQVWVPEMDPATCLPKRDGRGRYLVQKTGGLTATMLDILRALAGQKIFMVHCVDAIEAVNRDHQGIGLAVVEPEGLVVAGIDVVATDLLCGRHIFSNVKQAEAAKNGLRDRFGGSFVQTVPVPRYNGKEIVTEKGYDCLLARDSSLAQAAKEGLGTGDYYVVGHDGVTDRPLASQQGRLGYVDDGVFHEIVTQALYWDIYKMPWDLQRTFFGYLEAADQLEHTSLKQEFLAAFDEDKDGVVTYDEYGTKGMFGPLLILTALYLSKRAARDDSELFRVYFAMLATNLGASNPRWNAGGHDFCKELFSGNVAVVALRMSQGPKEAPDPFFPGLSWGNGKWPSFSLAASSYAHQVIYGWKFPARAGVSSLYGSAMGFADYRQNSRRFIGPVRGAPNPDAVQNYIEAVRQGTQEPLDFTLYVPRDYGGDGQVPNVEETDDPARIFTAIFPHEDIRWPDCSEGHL
jgi:hypothetical protein